MECEECGKQCRKPGEEFDTHSRTLTVHHIDMDPMNNDPENLIALCAGCHLKRHRKVKSLDKVIELAEHCLKPMGQNLCSTCPGRYANRCNVWEDSLHYLKEYKNTDENYKKAIAHVTEVIDHYEKMIADYLSVNNPALTWDELRTMEGKPVWVEQCNGDTKGWLLILRTNFDVINCTTKHGNSFYLYKSSYGERWQAYRKERTE